MNIKIKNITLGIINNMLATIIIAILTCLSLILSILFFPKIKIKNKEINTYWIIGLLGALFMILFKCISFDSVLKSLTSNSSVNPLKILMLFISMTILSIFLDEVGFFRYLASQASKRAKSSQSTFFLILYLLVSILTIFTSNDIVILTFTPFICYFAKNTKINPLPYLVAEFAAANTWSMLLIIGNPTNIYLGTSFGIDFISYFKVMLVPTLLAGSIEIILIYLLFKKQLKQPIIIEVKEEHIKDKVSLIIGLVHLFSCLVLLVISSYINLEMWLISLISSLSLILCNSIYYLIKKIKFETIEHTFIRLPWDLIPFVISMFIIVISLKEQGISSAISKLLGTNHPIINYGYSSFLTSNLINNIPMSVLYSTIPNMTDNTSQLQAIYSSIIGSNIGAFLSPLGALAGIMFTSLINKQNINYSFSSFVKYGIIISIPTLTIALLGLSIVL